MSLISTSNVQLDCNRLQRNVFCFNLLEIRRNPQTLGILSAPVFSDRSGQDLVLSPPKRTQGGDGHVLSPSIALFPTVWTLGEKVLQPWSADPWFKQCVNFNGFLVFPAVSYGLDFLAWLSCFGVSVEQTEHFFPLTSLKSERLLLISPSPAQSPTEHNL